MGLAYTEVNVTLGSTVLVGGGEGVSFLSGLVVSSTSFIACRILHSSSSSLVPHVLNFGLSRSLLGRCGVSAAGELSSNLRRPPESPGHDGRWTTGYIHNWCWSVGDWYRSSPTAWS